MTEREYLLNEAMSKEAKHAEQSTEEAFDPLRAAIEVICALHTDVFVPGKRADERRRTALKLLDETLNEYPLASFTPRQLECLETIIFTAFDVVALMPDERDQ
jgi:hypothetical protein